MSTLVIVESPTKARTIRNYLPPGTWYAEGLNVGWIRSRGPGPKSNSENFDVENVPRMFAKRLFKFTNFASCNVMRCTNTFKMAISANISS